MWDTFQPLRLSTFWAKHDNPHYALSRNEKLSRSARGLPLMEATTVIGRSP